MVAQPLEDGHVDPHADDLHLGQHPDERRLDVVVEVPQTLGVHGLQQRGGQLLGGQRRPAGAQRHGHGVVAAHVEVELALGGVGLVGQLEPGVAGQQVGQAVVRLGRVEQVGGQRGVDGQAGDVEVGLPHRLQQDLGVVDGDPAPVEHGRQGGAHGVVGEHAGGDPHHVGDLFVDHDGDALEPTVETERPGQPDRKVASRVVSGAGDPTERVDRRRRVGAVDDLGLEHLGFLHAAQVLAECLGQAIEERVELEELEQPLELVGVDLAHGQAVEAVGQLVGQVDVADQLHDDGVLADQLFVGGEVLAQLRGLLVDVGEDAVEVAVLVEQLGRRLLPHARDARQVVGVVAPHRRVHDVLVRLHARALEDAGLVVEGVVGHAPLVVEHPDVRVLDQLVHVAVAGDDDDVVTPVAGLGGQRGDDVVGLEPGLVDHGDAERRQDLAHQAHLLAEDVGGLGPAGLVVDDPLVAERGLGPVEGHGHPVGGVVAQHVDEHRREAVDGVGDLSGCGGQVGGQGEEGAVGQRVPVDQQEPHPGLRPPARCRGSPCRR